MIGLHVSYIKVNRSKYRPVLIRQATDSVVQAFQITSQFSRKSAYIQQQYYPIKDWRKAGPNKLFWVDLGTIYNFPKKGLKFDYFGTLSDHDVVSLFQFNHQLKRLVHQDNQK